jgi:PAS domain S-box-containing protein
MSLLKKSKYLNSDINYQEIFNFTHDAILIIAPFDESILEINNAAIKIFGFTREEFTGKKLIDISKNIELERKRINETLLNNSKINFETFRFTSNKKEICLEVNSMVIKYKQDNAILQLCRDVTQQKIFELAILESENKYETLYENYPLIHITINSDKKITTINKKGAYDLGYEIDELIDTDIFNLFASKEKQRLVKQILFVLDNPDTPSPHEMKMLKKDGKEFWVRETIYSSFDKDNQPIIFFICDNISWQKNAEAEAKSLAQSLQNMLDASPLGVLVYRLDENGELIFISTNQSAVNILQIDLYSLISKKIQYVFPGLVEEGVVDKFKAVISTGHPLKNQMINYKDLHFTGYYEFSAMRLTENTIAVFFTDITEKQNAIEALIKSELKYKTLFDSANDAIFLMKDDKFIDCNKKTTELFGCPKDEIIGKSPQVFSPDYQPNGLLSNEMALNKINLALSNNPQFFEWTHKKCDGSLFYAEISLKKIDLQNDYYLQAIVRDITKRKNAQKIISDQQRELHTLMSNLPGMAYRCKNNFNWTMQFVSEGCFPLTGYKPDELINDRVISYAQLIHKDDQLFVNDDVQKALVNKEPFTLLYRIISSDGKEKWVWEKGRGIYDEQNYLIYLEGFITDITERKTAEEKINMLAHTLKCVTECVCITDLRSRIKFINNSFSRTYGYTQHEIEDKNISIIRSKKNDPEMIRKILPETLAGGWTGNLINIRKDGDEFLIHLSTSLIVNDTGQPIAVAEVINEI